ncbi:MAG: beta-ketoacyl-ACP synthase III [Nitrosomonadales bacterium]
MIYSKIIGTGSYLPKKTLTNKDLEKLFDTSDDWITSRTGIKQRHLVGPNELTSDLALNASLDAIKSAQINDKEIDLILVATTTPDKNFPSTACTLQRKLKINSGIPAFDIQAVCSGFIFALTTADMYIKSGGYKCALVVGADAMSTITDYTDRSNAILWGDGAGAVILKSSDQPGIIKNIIHANGEYEDLLHVPKKSSGQKDTIEMQGNSVFKIAVNTLDEIVDETLNGSGFNKSNIDWLVPHQANIRILQATAKKLNLSMEQVIVTIDRHGNTSAASIPLALDEGIKSNKIKEGQLVLMEAFGGGFTWGSSLVRI